VNITRLAWDYSFYVASIEVDPAELPARLFSKNGFRSWRYTGKWFFWMIPLRLAEPGDIVTEQKTFDRS
jgi:hypothetical protein